jgi:hypothetical protein
MATPPPRKMFTFMKYSQMIDACVFKEDDRLELIAENIS